MKGRRLVVSACLLGRACRYDGQDATAGADGVRRAVSQWEAAGGECVAVCPEELGGLGNLAHLDLRANGLRSLPATIAELPRLKKLDLRWNREVGRPSWLEKMESRGCVIYQDEYA